MSQKNEINIVIPQTVLDDVSVYFTKIKETLSPYLHGLTKDEIESIFKKGDKTVAFVDKVKDYTTTNPEFIPNFMNVTDFVTDVIAVDGLNPIFKTSKQVTDDLNHTIMLAGNESLLGALLYYRSVKFQADAGVPSAQTIYDDLKKRFPGRGKSPQKPNSGS